MAPTMGHRDSPKCASTAFAEDLMFLETAKGHRYQPVTYIFVALFNLDDLFREFR